MGVRLVKYGVISGGAGTYNHNELLNRELPDQHPISAITGLEDRLKQINIAIEEAAGIENIINTSSLTLGYDEDTKTLTGNVNIFNSEDNALELKTTGLYVDKYLDIETEDTPSLHLTTEGKGETLKTMYQSGTRFSHNGSWTNIANVTEANAWYFDDSLDSFVQPKNTATFTGFVSTVKYRTYTHRATLKSTDSDNDGIGLVIAYAVDDSGNPHKLSFIINKGGEGHVGNYYYALVYDKSLPDEQVLFTKGNKAGGTIPGNHSTGGWSGSTITVEVNKAGATVTCAASNYGSSNIKQDTIIEINLDDYSWGYLFRGKVQYGYCAQSQPNSYYQEIYFKGKGPLKGNVIISPDTGNSLELRANGLYCTGGGSGYGNQIEISQASHGLTVGDVVYCDTDGLFKKALAEDSIKLEALGIVSLVTNANTFTLATSGLLAGLGTGFTNGDVLYLSQTTAGTLSISQELTILKPIGTKIPSGILINIQRATYMTTTLPDDTNSLVTYTP